MGPVDGTSWDSAYARVAVRQRRICPPMKKVTVLDVVAVLRLPRSPVTYSAQNAVMSGRINDMENHPK